MISNAVNEKGVEVGSFLDELFCLKRNFSFSNLTPVEGIKTVRCAKNKEEIKVAQVNLFAPDGEITVLELWNEDATKGVRYLWDLLGTDDAVLLKISKLSTPPNPRERRAAAYRSVPATRYMIANSPFPVKARIVANMPFHGPTNDIKKQVKRILISNRVQLLCDGLPLRHFSQWHQVDQSMTTKLNSDDMKNKRDRHN